jgi:hypothetical protein
MTPVFLLTIFTANLLLLDAFVYVLLLGGQLAFYAAALIGKWQRSPTWMFAIPLYYCGVNVAAACGLVRGILNRQPAAWERLERASNMGDVRPPPQVTTEPPCQEATSVQQHC